jgi:hypothetical protein
MLVSMPEFRAGIVLAAALAASGVFASVAGGTNVQAVASSRATACARLPLPPIEFTLGRAFAGLRRVDHSRRCQQLNALERKAGGVDTRFTSTIYGDCHAMSDTGCAPPLEIQNWPECARDYRLFEPDFPDGSLTRVRSRALIGKPIPATQISPTQIEIYSGPTTVVIFGSTSKRTHEAARALGRRVADATDSSSFSRLRTQAMRRPGCPSS